MAMIGTSRSGARVVTWFRRPEMWALRSARLSLDTIRRQSVALRRKLLRERFTRECKRLDQIRQTLVADAKLAREFEDPDAESRLALRIAAFYQELGDLERQVDTCKRA